MARPRPDGHSRFPVLDHGGPIAFAHRGGAAENPENTWAAFSNARRLGYRYFETDVHATADGVAVVIHDPDLTRVAGRDATVSELTWAELAQIRLGGEQTVPRLDEILTAWPEARWNLDAKADDSVDALVQTVTRTASIDRVCVTAFSDRRLARIRAALGPQLCTAMGPGAVAALRLASLLPPTTAIAGRFSAFGAAQVPPRWGRAPIIDRRFIDAAHRSHLHVHAWTIDTEPGMRRLLDLGVDGIMTDQPTLLRQVLMDRGAWPGGQ